MQVNDLVKVSAEGHEFEGQAGIVIESSGTENVVKLDLQDAPATLQNSELTFLGR